ncbi:MAG: hypothetical protein KGI45_00015 [Patescibacteria group bacterium]|nr:hypothetical protein [Patescibacteria group bacterium]MDE1940854.1 hypothetical protein [Patescibacteria group bacterium]MDE1966447.1 hypothetical protein [Patescibacteria group bacterium]
MAPAENNFLALPKPHEHVSRLLVLTIIMGTIVLLLWLGAVIWSTSNAPQASAPAPVKSMAEQITEQLSNAPVAAVQPQTVKNITAQLDKAKANPLTSSQKAAITKQLSAPY